MVPQHLLKSVVALARAGAEHGYIPLGAGVVLSARGLVWLVVPRAVLDSRDADLATRGRSSDFFVLIAGESGKRRAAVDIGQYKSVLGIEWTTGAPDNPFAAFPLPPAVAQVTRPLPEEAWQEQPHPQAGVRCWGIQDASVLPGNYGTLVLDGIICSIENSPGETVLTTIPSLPGSLGMPVLTENSDVSGWSVTGCITRRVRIPGGRRSALFGRAEAIEHFGVVEPLGRHASDLIDIAIRKLVEVLGVSETTP